MSSLPARFGPYEIIGPLGAGGMGQVFRARDTRLQRSVAIKVLHTTAAIEPERQRRFAQEAVAASALNHPNILTVYDIGVEGDTPYIVSELIDGGSLRAEMNRGRLALKRALDIAQQIAEGLAAAHDAGIVHRDLKPENVMVTGDGRVKIVDFGLAKTQDDGSLLGPSAATETAAGLIVGTVPYMSPEQARGGKADFRSDQFALGVVLYELTTATHPFKRDTSVQMLSAIIGDEPPDLAQVNPQLPVAVRWMLRRLLAKSPRERYAHTADLATDLRIIRDHLAEATTSALAAPAIAPRRRWPLAAALAAFVIAIAFIAGRALGTGPPGPTFERFRPLATDAGYQAAPAWSPDGKTIVYEAALNGVVQIFTRSLSSPMRTQVTNSLFDCYSPYWSADGNLIYYHSVARDRDALWRVSPAGGAAQVVMEGATQSTMSPDGKTLVALRKESTVDVSMSLWIASPPGSEPKPYARGALAGFTFSNGILRFAPNGSKVLAWLWRDADSAGQRTGFWELPIPEGEPRQLLASLEGLREPPWFSWLPDNRHIVLLRGDGPTPGSHLWLADTAADRLHPITATAGSEGGPSVSPDGRTIAFSSEATDFDLVEVPIDGSALRPFLSSTRNEFDPSASPVNTQYAFVTDRTGNLEIWLQNEEGYLQQPLITDADFGGKRSMSLGSLAFSPDGRHLAFQRFDVESEAIAGGPRLWIASTAGGTPFLLGASSGYQDAPAWSPDGEWVSFIAGTIGQWSLVKARLTGGAIAPVVLKTGIPPFVARPQWSPDGRWIVCETTEGLMLIESDGSGTRVISDPGWLAYQWAADARRIYGLRPTDDLRHFMLVAVDVTTGAEHIINANLGEIPPANQPIRGFSRLRDKGFLTSIARVRSDVYLIEGFRLSPSWWNRLWPWGR
jgi:Tol biopolymer transport system component